MFQLTHSGLMLRLQTVTQPVLAFRAGRRRAETHSTIHGTFSKAQSRLLSGSKQKQRKKKTTIFLKMASSKEVQGRSSELRVVLLGRAGDGKSASGNTILGSEEFQSDAGSSSFTKVCMKKAAVVAGRPVSVVDTPGFFDTDASKDDVKLEIKKCISLSAPGPHAFLLVMPVGPYTKQEKETVQEIQKMFSEKVMRFTIILFTRADDLEEDETIEEYLQRGSQELRELVRKCGGYHAFNNENKEDRTQVTALLQKIESMVAVNGGSHYTDEMYQQAETAIKPEQKEICGCAPMCVCL